MSTLTKPAPVKAAPATQSKDEITNALRALLVLAESAGWRDRPEFVQAHEVLAKHDAPAKHEKD